MAYLNDLTCLIQSLFYHIAGDIYKETSFRILERPSVFTETAKRLSMLCVSKCHKSPSCRMAIVYAACQPCDINHCKMYNYIVAIDNKDADIYMVIMET